jgi:hypothetical protein
MSNFYRMSEEEEQEMRRKMWESDMWHRIDQEEMAEIMAWPEKRMRQESGKLE